MDSRPPPSPEAVLARLGMAAESAIPVLTALGVWSEEGPGATASPVVEAIADSPNPESALAVFERLAERFPEGWRALVDGADAEHLALINRAALLASVSEPLGDMLATDPPALDVLGGDLHAYSATGVAAAVAAELAAADDPATTLAAAQKRGLLRVATRDVVGLADTPTVAAELSDLADGVLSAAFDHVCRTVLAEVDEPPRLAVLALGKLGGRELNYVSDVDVIFVCDAAWQDATRVCERFLQLCGVVTRHGRAYEVDANLRPEGRDGPLVRTLASYAAYYERWAHTWEFQALLKARPMAGDAALAHQFLELVAPRVWPDRLDAAAVAEIQGMKSRVEQSPKVRRDAERQVKLGPGGLRDIEFAVQLLQLVHGRHDPSLRSPNTWQALGALAAGGYIGEEDASDFHTAYAFLRTVEHRLQLARLRRTHTLPADDQARARLARALGFVPDADQSALERFDTQLRQVRALVRRLHEKLFYRPLLARFAELGADAAIPMQAGGDGDGSTRLDERAAVERLMALGFSDPEGTLVHLDALAAGVSRRARLFRTLLPALLPVLAATPDPDRGLAAFRSLVERLEDSPYFLRTLRDSPPVAETLMRVLGSSRVVGEWLQRQPEVLGELVDLDGLETQLEAADYRRLADGLLRRGSDPATAADGLRRLKRREIARTAIRDLDGQAEVEAVSAELSGLAEACLEAAVALAVQDLTDPPRLAVIGMGKLGAGELTYASDLDVLVVYEPAEAAADALRATERLMTLLSEITPEGQAFVVDPNLRPEGKDGPLARSLGSYQAYYERWAEHWELQALTQARPVAGDAEVGKAFVERIQPLVYPEHPPAERLTAVRRMKARVERERSAPRQQPGGGGGQPRRGTRVRPQGAPTQRLRPGDAGARPEPPMGGRMGDRIDLKLGQGGMADVEWTVQLLQLREGGRVPVLRRPGTLAAVEALEANAMLDAREAAWLRDGYRLLLALRNALYLGGFRDSGVLPPGAADQERVARMLGYPGPGAQALLEALSRDMRRIRRIHELRFYDA